MTDGTVLVLAGDAAAGFGYVTPAGGVVITPMATLGLRDRTAGTTRRVSVSNTGRQANQSSSEAAISGSGRYVVFTSGASNLVRGDTNRASDVFVRDLRRKTTIRVSVGAHGAQAKGPSYAPSISANARAFPGHPRDEGRAATHPH